MGKSSRFSKKFIQNINYINIQIIYNILAQIKKNQIVKIKFDQWYLKNYGYKWQ